ncbi:MAG: alpha-glucosidase family protein [Wenzhouxiangellaceae bacterium]|nr:alpha-glucosidase family protein [Wenzhouxiangellaceae bacterium]
MANAEIKTQTAVDDGTEPSDTRSPWWRGAVIYQIYPRSFQDSNDDGIGDLPGIISRIDYLADLGVDALWIAPFFKSPMNDFGYDVADPRAVDSMFGTLEDFDELLEKAHERGLKVIIDQVISHTSVEHEWFQTSRASRVNAKADWYVWADPKPDGTPPNNWLALFGGVAWQWESRRQQYYLHNFLTSQPDLNFHNADVRQAVLDDLRFWLDRGVDGFRLDAINFCYHDDKLRDNPPKPAHLRTGRGFSPDNPYAYQYHDYNNTRPENLSFIEDLRGLLDEYPGTTALGEISSEDSVATMAEYSGQRRLHMVYSFELLTEDFSAAYIRDTVARLESKLSDGWPCWAISNHDVERVASRWGRDSHSPDLATMLSALLGSLRGSICIYQGEELGLPEADVPFELMRDPYGIAFWPDFKGRDGCRTPMPWDDSTHAGFSSATPWLPVMPEHLALSVACQAPDPDSSLSRFKRLQQWRSAQPVLRWGSIRLLQTDEPVLAFVRELEGESMLAVFNLSAEPVGATLPEAFDDHAALECPGPINGNLSGERIELPAHGVVFARHKR